jgi:hypothetical protein
MARRRGKSSDLSKNNDETLLWAGLATAGVVSLVVIASLALAPIVSIGPEEGNRAPDFVADAYNGGSWYEFRMSDIWDWDWDGNSSDSKWILIQFIDTDCPYCWEEGDEMSQYHAQWKDRVTFVTVSVHLNIPNHESSKSEIEAFRDLTSFGTNENDGDGCNSGRDNCNARPGSSHQWTYVDDPSNSIFDQWELGGTPFSAILQPDGVVAWNKLKHQGQGGDGEDLPSALQRLVGDS